MGVHLTDVFHMGVYLTGRTSWLPEVTSDYDIRKISHRTPQREGCYLHDIAWPDGAIPCCLPEATDLVRLPRWLA
jgi:hypothetical protein